MALIRMNSDAGGGDFCLIQLMLESFLFHGGETGIGIDAEYQEAMIPAAAEQFSVIVRIKVGQQVERGPGIENSQVGIGIETAGEFMPLVQHITLQRMIESIPAQRLGGIAVICPYTFVGNIGGNKSLVADDAGMGHSR